MKFIAGTNYGDSDGGSYYAPNTNDDNGNNYYYNYYSHHHNYYQDDTTDDNQHYYNYYSNKTSYYSNTTYYYSPSLNPTETPIVAAALESQTDVYDRAVDPDGQGVNAAFYPFGVTVTPDGSEIFVTSTYYNKIHRIRCAAGNLFNIYHCTIC